MSLSRIEAQKLYVFKYNKHVEKDWIYYLIEELGIITFLELMDNFLSFDRESNKEMLEDFKECINYKYEQYACLGKSLIDRKEIDREVKIKAIENLIHFGASKIHMVVATQGTEFCGFIEEYVKDWIGMPSFLSAGRYYIYRKGRFFSKLYTREEKEKCEMWYWFADDLLDYEFKFELMNFWDEHPPSKIVLKDFKKVIELTNSLENVCEELSSETGDYESVCMLCMVKELLINFGAVITEKCIKYFEHESYIERMRKKLIKERASQIIVRNIEIAMDDEFYLTDLRKRIEKRRFEDLMKEKV